MSMLTDMANVSASGRINQHSFLLAAAGYIFINFEIRGEGPNFQNTGDIEMSVYLSDTGINIKLNYDSLAVGGIIAMNCRYSH